MQAFANRVSKMRTKSSSICTFSRPVIAKQLLVQGCSSIRSFHFLQRHAVIRPIMTLQQMGFASEKKPEL